MLLYQRLFRSCKITAFVQAVGLLVADTGCLGLAVMSKHTVGSTMPQRQEKFPFT